MTLLTTASRFAACLAAAAVLACAQEKIDPSELSARTQPYLPRAPYTFRAETRLVEVGVVVRDRRNQPVKGLDRKDFEIREGGKKREIAAFSVLTFIPAEAAKAAEKGQEAAVLPRGRFVGLLFDDLNSDLAEFRNSQLAAQRFVKEGLAAGDQVAIFTTTQAQVAPFTADPERLVSVIESLRMRKRTIDKGICPEISPYEAYLLVYGFEPGLLETKVEETRRCQGLPPQQGAGRGGPTTPNRLSSDPLVRTVMGQAHNTWQYTRSIAQNTLDTIRNVVEYMALLPGAKMLLLASGGFLSATLEYDQEEIIRRALRGGVVINALDAKGLFAGGPPEMPRGGDARSIMQAQLIGTRPIHATNDAIAHLSLATGGRFFHNSNDLEGGFRDLAAVPEVSYLLGFVPASEPDDKFHKISVRVTSGRGYSVQARPGYFAARQEAVQAGEERRIDQEVFTNTVLTQAPVELTVQPGPLADGGRGLVGVLRIDVKALPFVERSGARENQLSFVAALLDREGGFVTGREGKVAFALKQPTFEKLAAGVLTTRFEIQAPPGDYQLRLVAEEAVGKRITALTQPVSVR